MSQITEVRAETPYKLMKYQLFGPTRLDHRITQETVRKLKKAI